MPATCAASTRVGLGHDDTGAVRARTAAIATDRTPGVDNTSPFNDSSPANTTPARRPDGHLPGGRQHAHGDREVEARPLLAQVPRREVDHRRAAAATRRPACSTAGRIRSRASCTAAPGSPVHDQRRAARGRRTPRRSPDARRRRGPSSPSPARTSRGRYARGARVRRVTYRHGSLPSSLPAVPRDDLPRRPRPRAPGPAAPTAPARRSNGSSRTRIGRRSTGCSTARSNGRSIRSRIPIHAHDSSDRRRAGAGAGTRRAHGRRLPCLPRARRADDVQRAAPRCVQLLHASTARDVRRRRDARAVAPTRRRRLARGTGRRLRRGGGHPLARAISVGMPAEGVGRAHERRRHGQPHGARRRARGAPAAAPRRWTARRAARDLEGARVYASDQTHFSVARGLDVLGFPADALHVVASDDRFRLRAEPVADAIEADRTAGRTPLAISAVAGSTNTGSVDDVVGARVARATRGAVVPRRRRLRRRRAPVGARRPPGARPRARRLGHGRPAQVVLPGLRHRRRCSCAGAKTSSTRSTGRPSTTRRTGREDEPLDWYEYSIEGTRRFRALKLWMSWQHLGTVGLGGLVEHNDDLAAYLAVTTSATPRTSSSPASRSCRSSASGICPRRSRAGAPAEIDRIRGGAAARAWRSTAPAWVSVTTLRGATYLRAGDRQPSRNGAEVDGLLAALRRLSEGVVEDLDRR